ncbi:MAG: hypothetical protein GWN61_23525, partial [candidate division Zixibacteria bacterium]|nr:adenylate/guanylate cyclase domain-containing protein [Phycisphaerae bacterium]NIR67570.1 adenylate/guanylate cyclase domain-containing protein [candidate division Zixibacteria bacterium]NIW49935.1 hypothetical protein [Gammaproteobacteria bacterium]NIS48831.1 adenylate/guanylate cyclase domain-containing protein [candidate division Zixibacteria bacterium]NIU16910.1 adenylate/guanylate cyclase domain-containing protein [candidate division Zixibacteria bacterium]
MTIFFADMANFMGLSGKMDPEEISIIQDAYFQCCRRFIDHYGGQIEKYIGDAVMAVFGIPNLREQDPENAVRAALGIQGGVTELNQTLPLQEPIKVRIGINTGEVFVNYRRDGSFIVVGEVVNVTKRLEESAPNGGILIDH